MSTAGTGDVVETSHEAGWASVTVLVRYFASARAAAGVETETVRLSSSASVADVVEHLRAAHPERLPRILDAASFLLNGIAVRDLDKPVPDGAELDVLPPFAGG
ncbi:MoaD/ThiS family protein [Saccharomonospora sp.]|uniref:MoaD/ThiS family protein n=1 Tax=Saccharomonospora sp. TaxID=33913 RepID=UPI002629A767|nr:MoaD/ThiS family protein [Saccharomonospora sp.]